MSTSAVARLDAFQRRHPGLGLPLAVLYKFFDDQGTYLAALITYYGFLSLFPLLLLLSTILDYVVAGDAGLRDRILDSTLGQFPVVGSDLRSQPHISGSGFGLFFGIIGTLYGGLGVAQAAQNAMNTVWRVPRNSRPNPLLGRLRSLLLLVVVGLSVAGTTILSAIAGSDHAYGADVQDGVRVVLVVASLVINAAVFTLAFHVATARRLHRNETIPGAVFAALTWQALQYGGTAYVGHVVKNTTLTDSVFALVLGLIAWIYLEALVVVLAVEFNVVRSQRLYPRALLTPFTDDVTLTAADQASYTSQAAAQRAKGFERIRVSFGRRRSD